MSKENIRKAVLAGHVNVAVEGASIDFFYMLIGLHETQRFLKFRSPVPLAPLLVVVARQLRRPLRP